MAAWPTYAKIQFSGFSMDREAATKRAETDRGPAKVRKIRSKPMRRMNVMILLKSLAEYNGFIYWYEHDAQMGASFFDMTDPMQPDITRQYRFYDTIKGETPLNGAMTAWQLQAVLEFQSD